MSKFDSYLSYMRIPKATEKELTDTLIVNGQRVSVADMKRFWRERPDPGFSVERNKAVIANSIAKAQKHRRAMQKLQKDGLAQRVNALTSYIQYQKQGGTKKADDYFGRKELTRLQGKKVMQILQERKANGQPLWKVIDTQGQRPGYK